MALSMAETDLLERAERYVDERLEQTRPGSVEEMFVLLLERATLARRAGDYGIAACAEVPAPLAAPRELQASDLEIRHARLLAFAGNTLFSARDPSGHAELNALRRAAVLAASHRRSGVVQARSPRDAYHHPTDDAFLIFAPRDDTVPTLYATLEPCPMCTVCLLNAGIRRVWIAVSDTPAGTLAPERLAALPPIWRDVAARRGLEVRFADAGPDAGWLPAELVGLLRDLFRLSRETLDAQLFG